MYALLNAFITGLLISCLLSFTASIIAWRRSVPGLISLTLLLISMGLWAGAYAVQLMPVPQAVKVFLPNITYIGVVAVPTLFLLFAATFANLERCISRRLVLALSLEPLVTLLLVWTNQYHHLIFTSVTRRGEDGFTWSELVHGSWYHVNLTYSYAVIVVGIAVLVFGLLRASSLMKKQYYIMLVAALVPWLGNVVGEYFLDRFTFDITPLTFGFASVLFTYSVIQERFMDLIAVARGRLIENMSDGVLVLDVQNHILDINPAMQRLLDRPAASLLGHHIMDVLETETDPNTSILHGEKTRTEVRLPHTPDRYLDMRVTPLLDKHQHLNGRLMVFRDVTEGKLVEKKLRQANDRLQNQLIEIGTLQSKLRAQAIRDPLTDLFNRRYLDETLDRELARATRERYPVCVILMDLDHFKLVNDTYGHEAGDQVLKALAATLSAHNRRGDFACRFGGEEFVVVMPNITAEVAYQRAEKLRLLLGSLQIPYGKIQLSTTISMGIACYPSNGEDRETLLRAADRAMYAAKKAGRDHILTYDRLESQSHSGPRAQIR